MCGGDTGICLSSFIRHTTTFVYFYVPKRLLESRHFPLLLSVTEAINNHNYFFIQTRADSTAYKLLQGYLSVFLQTTSV